VSVARGTTISSPLGQLWALLFPTRCLGCGRRGAAVCGRCESMIPWLNRESCYRCAVPSPLGRLCARCKASPSALDGLRAACTFDGIVRQAIHNLKYRQARSLAELASSLLAKSLAQRPLQADMLVPVPLAAGRRRERGYNQAELIADWLSRSIDVPTAAALERVRETPPQVGLSAPERRRNVRGAFACSAETLVAGRRVIVLDDVATTGATLGACADVLKTAGAARVYGLVVARGS
jgi:ComF family protein